MKPIYIILLALGVLALGAAACAIQAPGQAPNALGPTSPPVGTFTTTPNALGVTGTPPPTGAFPYSAKVTDPLTVRDGAGEEFQARGYLDPGDIVEVYNHIRAKDGGLWASIDGGYVNSNYLDKIE